MRIPVRHSHRTTRVEFQPDWSVIMRLDIVAGNVNLQAASDTHNFRGPGASSLKMHGEKSFFGNTLL
jgi:hypothetical protein